MTSRKRKDLEALMGISLNAVLKETKITGFSGRCWGIKGSLLEGSHVTLGQGDEVVSAHIQNGVIRILEYRKTTGTSLGGKVRAILKSANLPFEK